MDLWIRSQDRLRLVKVNYVYTHEVNDQFRVVGETIGSSSLIGVYNTKERALEVLDEIQEKVRMIQKPKDAYYCVYEMPEK